MSNSSIWPIDRTLSNRIRVEQAAMKMKGYFTSTPNSRIGALLSDNLMSYPEHLLGCGGSLIPLQRRTPRSLFWTSVRSVALQKEPMYGTRPCCLLQAITQHTCSDPHLGSWNCLAHQAHIAPSELTSSIDQQGSSLGFVFQFLPSFFPAFKGRSKCINHNWYHCHPHVPQFKKFFFFVLWQSPSICLSFRCPLF